MENESTQDGQLNRRHASSSIADLGYVLVNDVRQDRVHVPEILDVLLRDVQLFLVVFLQGQLWTAAGDSGHRSCIHI